MHTFNLCEARKTWSNANAIGDVAEQGKQIDLTSPACKTITQLDANSICYLRQMAAYYRARPTRLILMLVQKGEDAQWTQQLIWRSNFTANSLAAIDIHLVSAASLATLR
jgi:hypothetical protein